MSFASPACRREPPLCCVSRTARCTCKCASEGASSNSSCHKRWVDLMRRQCGFQTCHELALVGARWIAARTVLGCAHARRGLCRVGLVPALLGGRAAALGHPPNSKATPTAADGDLGHRETPKPAGVEPLVRPPGLLRSRGLRARGAAPPAQSRVLWQAKRTPPSPQGPEEAATRCVARPKLGARPQGRPAAVAQLASNRSLTKPRVLARGPIQVEEAQLSLAAEPFAADGPELGWQWGCLGRAILHFSQRMLSKSSECWR